MNIKQILKLLQNTPNVPLRSIGAISVKYIGRVAVVSPEAKPTRILPTISSSTEDAKRQNWKHIAPRVNSKTHSKYDPFLKKIRHDL